MNTPAAQLWLCFALGLGMTSAWPAACFLSPKSDGAAGATIVQDGKEQVALAGARAFDNCARVIVVKGAAVAQYLDKQGTLRTEVVAEGKGIAAASIDGNAVPVRAVARGLLAVLTDPKDHNVAGQKFFDKPSQVGAPFGDVYIPPSGLTVRFANLSSDARVQIADAVTNTVVFDVAASQGLTLERSRTRPAGKYAVRVVSARDKLPPGAFEVVPQDVSLELDKALAAIDADTLLDARSRPIARALVFEHEGLSFNRDIALRQVKQ